MLYQQKRALTGQGRIGAKSGSHLESYKKEKQHTVMNPEPIHSSGIRKGHLFEDT